MKLKEFLFANKKKVLIGLGVVLVLAGSYAYWSYKNKSLQVIYVAPGSKTGKQIQGTPEVIKDFDVETEQATFLVKSVKDSAEAGKVAVLEFVLPKSRAGKTVEAKVGCDANDFKITKVPQLSQEQQKQMSSEFKSLAEKLKRENLKASEFGLRFEAEARKIYESFGYEYSSMAELEKSWEENTGSGDENRYEFLGSVLDKNPSLRGACLDQGCLVVIKQCELYINK